MPFMQYTHTFIIIYIRTYSSMCLICQDNECERERGGVDGGGERVRGIDRWRERERERERERRSI
jgi:hypothetical protein